MLEPVRALALDAAIKDGSAARTALQILTAYFTRGTACFVDFPEPVEGCRDKLLKILETDCEIDIEGRQVSGQKRTVLSQWKIFFLPGVWYDPSRVESQDVAEKLQLFKCTAQNLIHID